MLHNIAMTALDVVISLALSGLVFAAKRDKSGGFRSWWNSTGIMIFITALVGISFLFIQLGWLSKL
jgi:hypothetical protein